MVIFIVEDDALFSRKLQFEIESTSMHDVHVFKTAERAVGQLRLNPDVIFIDHFLDGINGTDVIPMILDKLPNCKVISVSSQDEVEVFQDAILNGAFRYLKKDAAFSENLAILLHEVQILPSTTALSDKFKNLFKSNPKRDKPLIFVIEDDETFNFMLRHKIDEIGKFSVECFTSGIEAINNAEKKPDLIIVDYNLEKINGSVVFEKFGQISPETKVIFISSQKEIDVALKASKNGKIDYITKGSNVFENLIKAIEKNLIKK